MYLNLLCKNEDIKYNITLNNILTAIVGDSSTGKTKLTDIILKNDYVKMETDAEEVVVYSSINVIKYLPANSIVLVDSDTIRLDDVVQISKLCRDDLYILYLGRKYLKNLPLSVYSMYDLKIVHGITKNIEIPFKDIMLGAFDTVLVEDSESGYKFFNNIFRSTITSHGNSNIEQVTKKTHKPIVIFDAVGFGGYVNSFLELANYNNIPYIGYKSFEGFILETLFNYTDTPIAFNIEYALLNELKKRVPSYNKNLGCTQDACSKCPNSCKHSSKQLLLNSYLRNMINFENGKSSFDSAINKMVK